MLLTAYLPYYCSIEKFICFSFLCLLLMKLNDNIKWKQIINVSNMKIDFAKVEINALDFFKLQRLMQWKLWEKLSLGYFWAGTLNKHCHLWNQHLRLCQWVKFHAKQKNFKFRTKISLFSQFSSSLKKLMSHLKSTLSNFWNCKVSSYIKKSLIWILKWILT